MVHTEIITEYKWKGHKQVLFEKYTGDESGYRVIIVKRSASLPTAQDIFLAELPEARRDMYIERIQNAMKDSVDATSKKVHPKRRKAGPNGKNQ